MKKVVSLVLTFILLLTLLGINSASATTTSLVDSSQINISEKETVKLFDTFLEDKKLITRKQQLASGDELALSKLDLITNKEVMSDFIEYAMEKDMLNESSEIVVNSITKTLVRSSFKSVIPAARLVYPLAAELLNHSLQDDPEVIMVLGFRTVLLYLASLVQHDQNQQTCF